MFRRVFSAAFIVLAAAFTVVGPASAAAPGDPTPTWIPNGRVNSVAVSGTTAYFAGSFDRVGPFTGGSARLDPTTGERNTPWPDVGGTVYATAPDGAGGWYIAGYFDRVGGLPRKNIVHVLADGTVDPGWDPVLDDYVDALAVHGNTVYAGGRFKNVDGAAQSNLVALDGQTGERVPGLEGVTGSIVRALEIGGTEANPILYVGGRFAQAAGQTRSSLAAYSLTTNQPTAFDPNVEGEVLDIEATPAGIYLVGAFIKVGGQARRDIARVDSGGLLSSWDPKIDSTGNLLTVEVSDGTVFVGGLFGTVNKGLPSQAIRGNAAAFNAGTAVVTPWAPNPEDAVHDLTVNGDSVYLVGAFPKVAGKPRPGAAAVGKTDGAVLAWNPRPGRYASAIATDGPSVVIGGGFQTVGGVDRAGVAAIDLTTGEPTAFDPKVRGEVFAVAAGRDGIWLGGAFNGVAEANGPTDLVKVDGATGEGTGFQQDTDGLIRSIAVKGDDVYVGGTFTKVGTTSRGRTAAFRDVPGTAGALLPWNPDANLTVNALALSGTGQVFLGGEFTSLKNGTVARRYLAGADDAGGTPNDWAPGVDAKIHALDFSGGEVLVAGDFTTVNGTMGRRGAIALDPVSGAATAWNAGLDGNGSAIGGDASTIYVGGTFTQSDGASRLNAAAHARSGGILPWAPDPIGTFDPLPVRDIANRPGEWVVLAGEFNIVSGAVRTANIAAYNLADPASGAGPGGGTAGQPGGGVAPTAEPDRRAPVISRHGATRKRFRVGRPPKRGTTFSLTLDEPARATFEVLTVTKKKGRKRLKLRGSFVKTLRGGPSKVKWEGKLGRRRLKRGSYVLRVRARDAAGNTGKPRTLNLRIIR